MTAEVPVLKLVKTQDPKFESLFRDLEQRRETSRVEVDRVVASIIDDVRQRGDDAVLDAIERFDGYRLTAAELAVSDEEIAAASSELDPQDREALEVAAERVRDFHASHVPQSWRITRPGELLGQEVRPIARAGIYVPGFKAPWHRPY